MLTNLIFRNINELKSVKEIRKEIDIIEITNKIKKTKNKLQIYLPQDKIIENKSYMCYKSYKQKIVYIFDCKKVSKVPKN